MIAPSTSTMPSLLVARITTSCSTLAPEGSGGVDTMFDFKRYSAAPTAFRRFEAVAGTPQNSPIGSKEGDDVDNPLSQVRIGNFDEMTDKNSGIGRDVTFARRFVEMPMS